MAGLAFAVAVVGFIPSYFIPLARGELAVPPLFHVHGALFFAWPAYVFAQAQLAGSGRMAAHREWGLLGVALATAMGASVLAITVFRLAETPAHPLLGAPFFAWLHVHGYLFFAGALVLALVNTGRPELHRKLILLATISLLNAPLARWGPILFGTSSDGPPLLAILRIQWPTLVVVGLMLAAALYARRAEGRWSRVWLIGAPLYAVLNLTTFPVGNTPAWKAAADFLRTFAG